MTRALYLSQTGLSEPLGRSQVVPYVLGLAHAGHEMVVAGFEPQGAARADIDAVTHLLADAGVRYHWTRRSPRHGLLTKLGESALALARLAAGALGFRPRIVHARSYLPGAVGLALARLFPGARLLFDCRGLLGDEYVDFGYWQRDSFNYKLLKRAERTLFGRADAVVTLTARLRRWLRDEAHLVAAEVPVEVIPCCVDLAHFRAVGEAERQTARAALGAGERFVLAFAGTLGAWYCEAEMAQLFAALAKQRPSLFAVYTRSPSDGLRAALRRAGVAEGDVRIASAPYDAMPAALAAADAAVSFAEPQFSKIASSPVKVAEYLACGLPVVMNRGVGDFDALIDEGSARAGAGAVAIDAGRMTPAELTRAAHALAALPGDAAPRRARARALATAHFALDTVGVARYRHVYEVLG